MHNIRKKNEVLYTIQTTCKYKERLHVIWSSETGNMKDEGKKSSVQVFLSSFSNAT